MSKMKIAVFGGSFNPLHAGHAMLADTVIKECGYDKVLFVPAFMPPHKILVNGDSCNFGIPVRKASQNRLICEHETGLDSDCVSKLLATLHNAYARAPYFDETYCPEVLDNDSSYCGLCANRGECTLCNSRNLAEGKKVAGLEGAGLNIKF